MPTLRPPPKFKPTATELIPFDGGWDTMTPPLLRSTGLAKSTQNWECGVRAGYRWRDGYERFSGKAKPSDAAYATLAASITGTWASGNTLTGATSGATAIVLTAVEGDGGYFVLTSITGTFSAGENLQIAAVTVAVGSAAQVVDGASTAKLHAQYKNLAADYYRTLIAAVTGSGDVLGVWLYNDVVYAFRNNVGATAAAMFKSTASGWSAVALGRELAFTSGGATEITQGQTITGAISGATAVLTRVVLESGSWAAGTAAGRFIFASQTGVFQAENIDVGASLNLATIAGNSSAITLSPSGRYEFENHNFGGAAQSNRMYGVDGVNRGFEFDGTVFVPIRTGWSITNDAPTHLTVHKEHLFFSFGASVQHSGTGLPYQWTLVTGAGEIAQGDTVTGFAKQPGAGDTSGALTIFSRNRISVLYGEDSTTWQQEHFAHQVAGAYAGSIQNVGLTINMDDRGLTSFQTTANYGNFQSSTLSQRIHDWIMGQRLKVNTSCIAREKNQYRIFFSDNYALFVTMDGKRVRGMMPQLFHDEVVCCCSGEMSDGSEALYFGSSDGFVYQMDKGTSDDGDDIEHFIELSFDFSKTPRIRKRYKHLEFEVQGEGYAEFSAGAEISYGAASVLQPAVKTLVTAFSQARWDAFTWDAFTWDGENLDGFGMSIGGTGRNISIVLRSTSDYYSPITVSGALLDYSERRRLRAA